MVPAWNHLFNLNKRTKKIINQIQDKDNELIDDFVSIITSFCGHIYGRKRKAKTQEIIDQLKLTPKETKDETGV